MKTSSCLSYIFTGLSPTLSPPPPPHPSHSFFNEQQKSREERDDDDADDDSDDGGGRRRRRPIDCCDEFESFYSEGIVDGLMMAIPLD